MRATFVLVILFITGNRVFPQKDSLIQSFTGIDFHYGFIIPHANEIEAVSVTNPVGIQLETGRLNRSFDGWEIFNRYLISGFQVGYFNFQNPEVLGSAFVLSTFAEPILNYGNRVFFSLRAGAGFSFHTKKYDRLYNPSNQFFSTSISFPVYLNLKVRLRIAKNIFLNLSGNYNHISNGGLKQPNYGMNFPTVSLGLQYYNEPVPAMKKTYTTRTRLRINGIYFQLQAITGYKVIDQTDLFPEKGTLALGICVKGIKQLTHFYALNVGAEMIMDGGIKETISRGNLAVDYKRAALIVGQDFLPGNVSFSQHLGFYFYSPYKARNKVYQKYELAYRFHPHIQAGVYLKAHVYVAELMGLTFSYLLFKEKIDY